jgi:hypothetical protein
MSNQQLPLFGALELPAASAENRTVARSVSARASAVASVDTNGSAVDSANFPADEFDFAAPPAVAEPCALTAPPPAIPEPPPADASAALQIPTMTANESEFPEAIKEARLWRDNGWTARVIKNENDDGWAVEMIKHGEAEPALVGPWTMGRDKRNPKPLDVNAFNTWVKTAAEVLRRHEQQLHAILHKEVVLATAAGRITVTLDIVPDDDDPHALLAAVDAGGEELAKVRVQAGFKLTPASAAAWLEDDYRRPAG